MLCFIVVAILEHSHIKFSCFQFCIGIEVLADMRVFAVVPLHIVSINKMGSLLLGSDSLQCLILKA